MVSTLVSTSTQHTFKHVILRTPMHAHMSCYLTLLSGRQKQYTYKIPIYQDIGGRKNLKRLTAALFLTETGGGK